MFYISSFNKERKICGITDTKDGVEELFSLKESYNFKSSYGLNILGLECNSRNPIINVYKFDSFSYRLINVSTDEVFTISKYAILYNVDSNIKRNIYEENLQLNLVEVAKLNLFSKGLSGLNTYLSSKISDNDTVLYYTRCKKHHLVKLDVFKHDAMESNIVQILDFLTCKECLDYCSQHNLTVANDFYTAYSSRYSSIRDTLELTNGEKTRYIIDRVLRIEDIYVPMNTYIIFDCINILGSLFSKRDSRDYNIPKYGKGFYNNKYNCFRFTPYRADYTISFELGTSEPESDILKDGYDWHKDIEEFGVCIIKVDMHERKSYKTDIEFYTK